MNDKVDTLPDSDGTSRRRLLAALAAGGLAALTMPHRGSAAVLRDSADVATLNAAMNLENRMAATCAVAGESLTSGADRAAVALLRDHHLAYAHAIKGVLGPDAVDPDNTPLARPSGAFVAVAAALAALENDASATHLGLIPNLIGVSSAALLTSIASVESRHAAALEMVSGVGAVEASR